MKWTNVKICRRCRSLVPIPIALLCPRRHRAEALSDGPRLTSDNVRLSVAYRYIGPNSWTKRPIGRLNWHRGSPRHTWLGHHFQGQKVKCQLVEGGAYCGGLPHSLLSLPRDSRILIPMSFSLFPCTYFHVWTSFYIAYAEDLLWEKPVYNVIVCHCIISFAIRSRRLCITTIAFTLSE